MNSQSININYIRGLYDFLFGKTDEELENYDLNVESSRIEFFQKVKKTFANFGPVARENIENGLIFISKNPITKESWRSVIPHDLPLPEIQDKNLYLLELISCLDIKNFGFDSLESVSVSDEMGPNGLNFDS